MMMKSDSPSTIVTPDQETEMIAQHLIAFLREEVRAGRLTNRLAPLQSGIGSVSNAVFHGFLQSEFTDLEVYSEVLQDAVFELMDAGKVKDGNISSIVPFVSHVDHTEHDVDVVVTEQGYADLRDLAPRERAPLIIARCAYPTYREQLLEYYQEALARGGQTPHVLEKALSWHTQYAQSGTMLQKVLQRG